MSAPIQILNVLPSGGSAPIGVIANRGASGSSQDAFANTLVQALIGPNGTIAPAQSTLLAASLLAGLVPTDSAETESKPGDVLTQWLASLKDETDLQGQEELLDGLMALLELAQAIVTQWQPSGAKTDDSLEDAALTPTGANGPLSNKYADLLHTLRQLAALARQQPNESEVGQIVQAFERMIAPMLTDESAKPADAATAAQHQAQTGSQANAAQQAASAVTAQHSSRSKSASKQSEGEGNVQSSFATAVDMIGNERKSRLEALAAKAGVQPQFAFAATVETTGSEEKAAESAPAVDTGSGNGASVQTNHPLRHLTPHHQTTQTESPVVRADRFAEDMAQAMKSLKVNASTGMSEVRITLMPEHLGQVDVKVSMHNGQIVAHFMADTTHGKEMLESQLSQLRAVLNGQGLQVDRLEVSQSSPAFSGLFQDSRQQQSSQQFDRKNKSKSSDYEQGPVDFVAELESLSGRQPTNGDSSFDVTA
ncbi:flagellar hook-length control protein FliK [Paenibacillus flagellatus]|nr:flagellar hook-length control protein FliK [Paenibacillus flagellatus]